MFRLINFYHLVLGQKIGNTGREDAHRKERRLEGKLREEKNPQPVTKNVYLEDSSLWGPMVYPKPLQDLPHPTASCVSPTPPRLILSTVLSLFLLHPWFPNHTAERLMGHGGGRRQRELWDSSPGRTLLEKYKDTEKKHSWFCDFPVA